MDRRYVPLSVGLVVCSFVVAVAWSAVKLSHPRTIDVRGLAKKRIQSDLAEWSTRIAAVRPTRVEAYTALKSDVAQAVAFLKDNGVTDPAVRVSAAELVELSHDEVVEEGQRSRHKTVFDGWQAEQRIEVSSSDVARVERLSREATQLLEKGLSLHSDPPRYLYTRLGEVKVEMLAEAARDARARADGMLAAAGGGATVRRVAAIDTGVVNINPANSVETSWEGKYDTSSFEKDIITTVRVRFEVRD